MNILAVAAAAAVAVSTIPILTPASGTDASDRDTCSSYIIPENGDFNQVFSERPAAPEIEWQNHRTRLQKIETMLRSHTVEGMSEELRAERSRNLDRLHDYWVRGEFPRNYEHPTAWEPCFIDRAGAICAVGYLVEQSAGRSLAEKIADRYRYATVRQIDAPELQQWIANSGLTRAEVIAIQGPSMRMELNRELIRTATEQPADTATSTGVGPTIVSDSARVTVTTLPTASGTGTTTTATQSAPATERGPTQQSTIR